MFVILSILSILGLASMKFFNVGSSENQQGFAMGFLLGGLPQASWNEGTPEQQKAFMEDLAERFGTSINCQQGKLYAMKDGDFIKFYFNCEVGNGI